MKEISQIYLKEFPIWNGTIIVHIIYTESKTKLWLLVSLDTELWNTLNEL